MSYYSLNIYTPNKILLKSAPATSLTIPTVKGEITVLPEHTHIVSRLDNGILVVRNDGKKDEKFVVSSGICKVLNKEITILATTCEKAEKIDKDRAKKALDKAMEKLSGKFTLPEDELEKYRRKLSRAQLRMKAAMEKY
jgi:F-type H+-transporting ATPase subunit epsilon